MPHALPPASSPAIVGPPSPARAAATVASQRPAAPAGLRVGQLVKALLELSKPRIVLLLLLTELVAMDVARGRGLRPFGTTLALAGLALTAAGANALNMWWDRDIDAAMARTGRRPLPAGRLPPALALAFGLATVLGGALLLDAAVNPLAASLALAGAIWYVLVYTMWLKRRTAQNVVVGGVAGALAPMVGWAAASGHVAPGALALALLVFIWTPPHFWTLALFRSAEYRRARVPMLPVVCGEAVARRWVLGYALVLLPTSILLPWTGALAWGFLGAAVPLTLAFVAVCALLLRESEGSYAQARLAFAASIAYLAAVFATMPWMRPR